jgi:hypothetical protein
LEVDKKDNVQADAKKKAEKTSDDEQEDDVQADSKKKEKTTDNEQEDDVDPDCPSDSDSDYVGEGASKKASKKTTDNEGASRKASKKTTDNEQEDDMDTDLSSEDSDSDYVGEGASKKASKPKTKFRPFTNGLDLDTVTQDFRFIVEREKEKEFADWTPSPAFLGIIYRWSGKPKFHYYNDIYNCTEVCAVELGSTIFDYIRLRGWIFSRPAKASGLNPFHEHIEYR